MYLRDLTRLSRPAKAAWKISLLVALLLIGGAFSEAIHFAVIPHEYCAEHDAYEHTDGAHHEHAHASQSKEVGQAEAGNHEHLACAIALTSRKRDLAVVNETVSAAPTLERVTHRMSQGAETVFTSLSPIDVSPKNSPPVFSQTSYFHFFSF